MALVASEPIFTSTKQAAYLNVQTDSIPIKLKANACPVQLDVSYAQEEVATNVANAKMKPSMEH